ncbi:hypothetical protein H4219_002717 [Mycoemilia scoparia]|uniref:CCHC-type domain-containing protein n=1 Tax=Mycoemilia scoparia TaxID=417184 RepID=A0A9W8A0J2_9FUNG|nr:hypothetical protein H4219_002717 [Mycoemilia scoparia]
MPSCYNCHSTEHLVRECTAPKTCHTCGLEGHLRDECDKKPEFPQGSAFRQRVGGRPSRGGKCFNCGGIGHRKQFCPSPSRFDDFGGRGHPRDRKCYNCGKFGHISKECEQEHNKSCYKCGKEGHILRDCPESGAGDKPIDSGMA